jgi:amidase
MQLTSSRKPEAGASESTDLVFATTTQIVAAIRAGDVSAAEALEAHLKQIEKHNPALNAVVIMDTERARARAREADEALARGELWGPLHGVPFTLKDAHSTAGMRTTAGFPSFEDYVPPEDGTLMARLRQAGAILMGKTNVATMLGDYQSSNPIFGRTNNPWNVERTPGGSSGGAAAALSAGMTPFEIGTDLAASIRIPSHFCGVFGFKPTENRVPLTGLIPNPDDRPRGIRIMSSIGPMARAVEDLCLLDRIIAGPDGQDTDVRPLPDVEAPEPALRTLRIAYAPAFPGLPVAAVIRDAVAALARQMERAGAVVEEAPLPRLDFGKDFASAGELIGMMVGAGQPDRKGEHPELRQYFAALQRRDRSMVAWERLFGKWDALLCPAAMVTAFPHCKPGTPLEVDGGEVSYWLVAAYGTIFNYTGHPAVALPYEIDRDGLPFGLQLVGKKWDDRRLLGIARAMSRLIGGFRRPPGY